MVPSWPKFCARGLFCSLKEIRRIKDTFVENWHFLLEVVRTDGGLALESRFFLLSALPSALLPLCAAILGPRPPGSKGHPESGPWRVSWQGGGVLEVLPFLYPPQFIPLRMFPKHGRGQGSGKRLGPHAVPSGLGAQVFRTCPSSSSAACGRYSPGPSWKTRRKEMGVLPANANSWRGRGARCRSPFAVTCN